MSIPPQTRRTMRPNGRPRLMGAILGLGLVVLALWAATLFLPTRDGGSLDERVSAVGATVRCPICQMPIPLNDVQNAQALQMRQYIRDRLKLGDSEDQVRQQLVQRYGPGILLAPPQRGFDLLVWLVPLAAVTACAVAIVVLARRWSSGEAASPPTPDGPPSSPEARRYEELLDRELAARE